MLPNGKHKIVFIDFGNYAEVDEILELTEALASIPCHLQSFFMRGVKRVESDQIDNEIDRKVHTNLSKNIGTYFLMVSFSFKFF